MPQLSINAAGQPVAVAGQLSDSMEGVDTVSRFNADTTQIPFGVAVAAAAGKNHGVLNLATIADVVEGVNVWTGFHLPANALGTIGDIGATGLLPNAGMTILRRGRMYVLLDSSLTTITPYSDRPFVRAISHAGVGTVLGAFTNAADGSDTIDCTRLGVFVGQLMLAADGVSKIAECELEFTNRNS